MACIRDIVCKKCKKTKTHEVVHESGVCATCRHADMTAAKRRHLAGLTGLTVEERLALIEERLYDEQTHKLPPQVAYGAATSLLGIPLRAGSRSIFAPSTSERGT